MSVNNGMHGWGDIRSAESLVSQLSRMGVKVSPQGSVQAVDVLAMLDKASFLLQLSAEAAEKRISLRSEKLAPEERAEIEGEVECLDDCIIMLSEQELFSYTEKETKTLNAEAVSQVIDITNIFKKRAEDVVNSRLQNQNEVSDAGGRVVFFKSTQCN